MHKEAFGGSVHRDRTVLLPESEKADSFTKFPNELLEVLLKKKLSGAQWDCFLVILRYTKGFHRSEARLSLSFISEAIGRHKSNVRAALKDLVKKGVIEQIEEPSFNHSASYRICDLDTVGKTATGSENSNSQVVKTPTPTGTENTTKKEKKKESIKESASDKRLADISLSNYPKSKILNPQIELLINAFCEATNSEPFTISNDKEKDALELLNRVAREHETPYFTLASRAITRAEKNGNQIQGTTAKEKFMYILLHANKLQGGERDIESPLKGAGHS